MPRPWLGVPLSTAILFALGVPLRRTVARERADARLEDVVRPSRGGMRRVALLAFALHAVACRGDANRAVDARQDLAIDSLAQEVAALRTAADSAPHRRGFVSRGGVQVHYLDWGGTGPAVVLLPGYALTAHAFDEIGTALARDFRVVAMTPRGFGESDAPDAGEYTIATIAGDLAAMLDSLGIRRAALVGHSYSSSTITAFARAHPDRVTRLVFLDGFPYFAEAGGDSVAALTPVPGEGFTGEMTRDRLRDFLRTYRFSGWSPGLEADLRASAPSDLARRHALTEGYLRDQRAHPPDVAGIAVPALQLCAMPTVATQYPWVRPGTELHARAARYVRDVLLPFDRRLCARFAATVPGGRTREVAGSHYVFFTQPALTVDAVRRFLAE